MKITLGKLLLAGSFCVTPLVSFAQNIVSQPSVVNRGVEKFTLLTGPHLLSPPTRPLNSSSISSEQVRFEFQPAGMTKTELGDARQKLTAAQERLNRLRAERAALLAKKKQMDEAAEQRLMFSYPSPNPSLSDPIRFDAQLPKTSTRLVPTK
jgi:hypothetical protein